MKNSFSKFSMRIIHRYLGFFLAGIMAMYALSGIIMVYRNNDTFKKSVEINTQIEKNLSAKALGEALKIKGLKVTGEEQNVLHFNGGSYNSTTGETSYIKKEFPYILEKMTHIHKATTKDPLYYLNLFFGASLLFFVISSFWMFTPGSDVFKKGIYFTIGGIILTFIMIFVG